MTERTSLRTGQLFRFHEKWERRPSIAWLLVRIGPSSCRILGHTSSAVQRLCASLARFSPIGTRRTGTRQRLFILRSIWTIADSTSACQDRKSTRLNSSHPSISYAVFCLKKKKKKKKTKNKIKN